MTQPKTTSKFTPGPWLNELHASNNYPKSGDVGCYDSPLDGWVAEVRTPIGELVALAVGNDNKETESRARLIAAAPEMYELLKRVAEKDKWWPPHMLAQEARRIKAAIDGGE
ncbi:hypothetical protein LCGC14_0892220 [marine sediment metagenome]|uniref:Uncharacterized protein n=1 Tax=marine sediment metagenome TaxID=412755 RepID=A0A0F9P3R6_9ZZZZ